MIVTMFQAIIITSVLGTFFALALMAAKSVTKKFFSAAWNYYIWLGVLLVMILPVRFHLPIVDEDNMISQAYGWANEQIQKVETSEAKEAAAEVMTDNSGHRVVSASLQEKRVKELMYEKQVEYLAYAWAVTALVLFVARLVRYGIFLRKIRKTTEPVGCTELLEYTGRKVKVCSGAWVSSPLLLGIFRPILLMPQWELTKEQLHNVLAHEMTHLRRNDMLYKWFVALVKCLHWFNPMVYFVSEQVNQACEISCDLSVTKHMDKKQKMSYVETILTLVAEHRPKEYALTMGMSGNKKLLKKRFLSMKKYNNVGKRMSVFSYVLATLLLVGALVLSGEIAVGAFQKEEAAKTYFVSECENCEAMTLFAQRNLVIEVQGSSQFHYNVYTYRCAECRQVWNEREAVEGEYAVKYSQSGSYGQLISIEEFPVVIDAEAEMALGAAGITLTEEAESTEEALAMIRKAIEAIKEND